MVCPVPLPAYVVGHVPLPENGVLPVPLPSYCVGTVALQLPADVMVKLYYSLVYSHLTYALLAWGRSGLKKSC